MESIISIRVNYFPKTWLLLVNNHFHKASFNVNEPLLHFRKNKSAFNKKNVLRKSIISTTTNYSPKHDLYQKTINYPISFFFRKDNIFIWAIKHFQKNFTFNLVKHSYILKRKSASLATTKWYQGNKSFP